ncbi:anaerobic sulfatase maturase [Fusobacterium sp.]|uniref:anaerobic sulfatase maturase n=1 Tax=Fusobacterium sp. TaxID=68766 RepID=UPI002617043B|nr:anaerobic sulfatase maturase [Fusobacterium sp.]
MRNINLLIKPASSSCNLRCKYCFYFDVSNNREVKNYGIMNDETLENLVRRVYEEVTETVNFAFQGGEPTIAGLEYFKKFHKFVEKYNTKNITTNFALQTNGTLLDKKWAELFKKYNYLIGISLDGNKEIHNHFRVDAKGEGTFNDVFKATKLLKKYEVEFNILCVVNKLTAQNGKLIYNFFRKSGFRYYQFIPCLDSLSDAKNEDYSLTAEDFGIFLDETFNLWYEDIVNNRRISVRHFDNYIKILLGGQPEACDMVGHCNMNVIVESDGSAYPCDFYVLDELKIGNLNDNGIEEMLSSEKERQFLSSSLAVQDKCRICKYFKICRGGCRRHKEMNDGVYENRFCESYKYFFDRNIDKMLHVAEIVRNFQRQNNL